MSLQTLEISNLRCIEHAALEFDSGTTLIAGDNAAGKTTILEAIHLLSTGRSFRQSRPESLPRILGNSSFSVAGKVNHSGRTVNLGFRWNAGEREIRIGGESRRGFADLATVLPAQVIDPGAHRLLEEGPSTRRRFLDWGVFHVEHSFIDHWKTYSTALLQRNAALKRQQTESLVRSWDEQLVYAGEKLTGLRIKYSNALEKVVQTFSQEILGATATLRLKQGWQNEFGLAESLDRSWQHDLRFRATTVGPHRSDLEIQVEGRSVKDRLSRGQQKLLACVLKLAQLQYRDSVGLVPGCLLLDDPAAELDVNNLGKLLHLIKKIPCQVVVTACDPRSVEAIYPGKKFHVEQGYVVPML